MLGCFPEGMPLAYLIATVVTGLGLLVGSLVHVCRTEQVARNRLLVASPLSALPAVGGPDHRHGRLQVGGGGGEGRGTGAGAENPTSYILHPKSLVALGDNFALASGLMEITYDTGAKVILQGPVTYEVESNGGYLAVGKLTGKLEKKVASGQWPVASRSEIPSPQSLAPSPSSNPQSLIPNPFVVRTPTATVVDLGTEFGVEVSRDGSLEVHVLAGEVNLAIRGGSTPMRLTADSDHSAARVASEVTDPVNVRVAPERFVRKIRRSRRQAKA